MNLNTVTPMHQRLKRYALAALSLLALVPTTFAASLPDTAPTSASAAAAPSSTASAASSLSARYTRLKPQLASSAFERPLVIESSQSANSLRGEAFGVVPYSFANVGTSLADPQVWCTILSLHLNTKYCVVPPELPVMLQVNVGKKFDQPLADSFRLSFGWERVAQNSDYTQVVLSANSGPLGTHDYRITLEAIPLPGGSTFVHLSYSYGFGFGSKLAMMGYLSTVGAKKVGFTKVGVEAGQPVYVDGMRGLIERNTMRYHLAIEAFLGAQSTPAGGQFEKRINDWFDATDQFPRQLHEVEKDAYLEMKRSENRRQKL